jgi:hypothetical protein
MVAPSIAVFVILLFLACDGNAFFVSPVSERSNHVVLKSAGNNEQQSNEEDMISRRSSRRRQFLFQAAGALSTAPVILAANANPSIISSIQGPVQDIIAPGHWLGQLFGINSKTVQWTFKNASPEKVSKALVDVLEDLTPDQRSKLCIPNFSITRADSSNVHVRTWTKNEWLDSMDVSLKTSSDGVGCIAKASFYATGFLPTSIPGAPIINIEFAWFPFASPGPRGEMLQDFRLRALESLVSRRLQET